MQRAVLLFSFALLSVPTAIVIAQSSNSPQYNGYNLGTTPATVQASSPNYILNGSIESITGETATSTNFQGGAGAPKPFTPSTTSTPPTPTGGGGLPWYPSDPLGLWATGTSVIASPTIEHRPWTYLSTGKLFGKRGVRNGDIVVNLSSEGVAYSSAEEWTKLKHGLHLGNNLLTAQVKQGSQYSLPARSVMRRRLQGDYNDTQFVDDIDLSLFSRAWEKHDDVYADFNEDGRVDDLDLSLLVSHWNHSF